MMTSEEIRGALQFLHNEIQRAEECLNYGNRAGVNAQMLSLSQHANELQVALDADRRAFEEWKRSPS